LDLLNGGGWSCIYSLQPLPSRCSFSTDRGRPAPLSRRFAPAHQRLESQRSAVTAIVHLMRHQMSDKVVTDSLAVHPGQSVRTLICILPNPSHSGFSGFSTTGRSALEAARSSLGLGWCSLLFRTVRSVNLCFCSVPV
jgi:hypothetical protein